MKRVVLFALIAGSLDCTMTPDATTDEPFVEEPAMEADDDTEAVVASSSQPLFAMSRPYGWSPMASASTIGFSARSDATAVAIDEGMFVYGGKLASGSYTATSAIYGVGNDAWGNTGSSTISARSSAIGVHAGTKIYLWGGRNASYSRLRSGGIFSLATHRWYAITSAPYSLQCDPQGGYAPATKELVVVGCIGSSSSGYTPTAMAYDTINRVWRVLPTAPYRARLGAKVTVTDNKLVVFGGTDRVTKQPLNDVAEYDLVKNVWQYTQSVGTAPREYAAAGVSGGRDMRSAMFFGGRPRLGDTAFSDGGAWDTLTNTWTAMPNVSLTPRRYVNSWYTTDRFFVWGGRRYVDGATETDFNDGAFWDRRSGAWTTMDSLNAPTARAKAYSAYSNGVAIVWGGMRGSTLLSDGKVFRAPPRDSVSIGVDQIALGFSYSCGVRSFDRSVECWGTHPGAPSNEYDAYNVPHEVKGITVPMSGHLSAGGAHMCLSYGDGRSTVTCWPQHIYGAVSPDTTPREINIGEPVSYVSAGGDHTCAVAVSGALYCWGHNSHGEVGVGSTEAEIAAPRRVPLDNVSDVSAGGEMTCAIAGGLPYCWGRNLWGALGDGTEVNRSTPVRVLMPGSVYMIVAGRLGGNACARDPGGRMYCWGGNSSGQLGNGTVNYGANPYPQYVSGMDAVSDIEVGSGYTCGRLYGKLYCWGDNLYGQTGHGTSEDVLTPRQVALFEDIRDVAIGAHQTCVRTNSGRTQCWGNNRDGQLGDGTLTTRRTPGYVLF
jgi:hypothetical protein